MYWKFKDGVTFFYIILLTAQYTLRKTSVSVYVIKRDNVKICYTFITRFLALNIDFFYPSQVIL